MVEGAFACVLIGRSIIAGKVIDNSELLKNAAKSHRFKLVGEVDRAIPSTRKTFNPAHGTISEETLLVFLRP
jgi:hypothetical protein